MSRAYKKLYEYLTSKGYKPKTHWLDNEAPAEVKKYNKENNTAYQLVPPYVHQYNTAEQAIRTFKKHFKAILAQVDKNFPMHLWCRLLYQATLILNILRPCPMNPKPSAQMALEDAHDFSAHPLAPPGCELTVHQTIGQTTSWGLNGIKAWYLGPACEHY